MFEVQEMAGPELRDSMRKKHQSYAALFKRAGCTQSCRKELCRLRKNPVKWIGVRISRKMVRKKPGFP